MSQFHPRQIPLTNLVPGIQTFYIGKDLSGYCHCIDKERLYVMGDFTIFDKTGSTKNDFGGLKHCKFFGKYL